jgi:hypothetical protein
MIGEIIRALLMGSLPVTAFTFLVLQWSIASGYLNWFEDDEGLQKQFKDLKKAKSEEKRCKKAGESLDEKAPKQPFFHKKAGQDFLHNKVTFFGGGFYGTMALFTYVIVELGEIFGFLGVVFTPGQWFVNLSFNFLVDFFINSIMNIVAAFVWFSTLPNYVPVENGFIWVVAAYVGYLAGVKLVSQRGDVLWAQLNGYIQKATEAVGKVFSK